MEYHTILYEECDGLGVIALNRPEVMNALSSQMRAELLDIIRTAGTRVRVLAITGTGRAFCSGQDLGDGTNVADIDLERVLREEYEPMLRAIYECPVPVIAAVNGAAAGAGANLALACDVVIAARAASFIQAFTRIGLMPDAGGTWWLPRQVGHARAMGAALFAERISAETAAKWGMIWEMAEDDAFDAAWRARARALASGPTTAFRNIKAALRASHDNSLEEQLAMEASLQGDCGQTNDFREGVLAFTEKRAPSFTGR